MASFDLVLSADVTVVRRGDVGDGSVSAAAADGGGAGTGAGAGAGDSADSGSGSGGGSGNIVSVPELRFRSSLRMNEALAWIQARDMYEAFVVGDVGGVADTFEKTCLLRVLERMGAVRVGV
jgi:hypothetical protein